MYRHMPTCRPDFVPQNRLRGLFDVPESDDIRHDLVARVRQEIAAGTYETPEKWQAALDRLAEDLK
jgi:hypothetical protein